MKIAVLAGDGIGPEIVGQALKVLRRLAEDGLKLEFEEAPFGGAGFDAHGDPLPASTLKLAKEADAVLCGAVGGPKYDALPRAQRPEQGILRIRKELGLFANLRPAVLYPELVQASTLKPEVVSGLDLMIIRELTGDIYFGEPRGRRDNARGEKEGYDTMLYSEPEIRRIAEVGFQTAMKRGKKLCSVDKENVLETSRFWREIVIDVDSELHPPAAVFLQRNGVVKGKHGHHAAFFKEGGEVVDQVAVNVAGAQQLRKARQLLALAQTQLRHQWADFHEAAAQRALVILVLNGTAHQLGRAHGQHRTRAAGKQQRFGPGVPPLPSHT